ncbi:hypothetical protein GCM10009592_32730 [Brachybacterium rhamnosum]
MLLVPALVELPGALADSDAGSDSDADPDSGAEADSGSVSTGSSTGAEGCSLVGSGSRGCSLGEALSVVVGLSVDSDGSVVSSDPGEVEGVGAVVDDGGSVVVGSGVVGSVVGVPGSVVGVPDGDSDSEGVSGAVVCPPLPPDPFPPPPSDAQLSSAPASDGSGVHCSSSPPPSLAELLSVGAVDVVLELVSDLEGFAVAGSTGESVGSSAVGSGVVVVGVGSGSVVDGSVVSVVDGSVVGSGSAAVGSVVAGSVDSGSVVSGADVVSDSVDSVGVAGALVPVVVSSKGVVRSEGVAASAGVLSPWSSSSAVPRVTSTVTSSPEVVALDETVAGCWVVVVPEESWSPPAARAGAAAAGRPRASTAVPAHSRERRRIGETPLLPV